MNTERDLTEDELFFKYEHNEAFIEGLKFITTDYAGKLHLKDFYELRQDFNYIVTHPGVNQIEFLFKRDWSSEFLKKTHYDAVINSGHGKTWLTELKYSNYPLSFFENCKGGFYDVTLSKLDKLKAIASQNDYLPYLIIFFSDGNIRIHNLTNYDNTAIANLQEDHNYDSTTRAEKYVFRFGTDQGVKYQLPNFNRERTLKRAQNKCAELSGLHEYLSLDLAKPKTK